MITAKPRAASDVTLSTHKSAIETRTDAFCTAVGRHSEMSPADRGRMHSRQILELGTTDGIEVLERPVVMVTVKGARSGKPQYVPLMRVERDGRYALIASKGGDAAHPSWYYNVKANPAVTLQDGAKVVELTARELDGAEREMWWRFAVDAFPPYAVYQTKTERLIPVFLAE
jgi:F420H(2)-dependent quinone reductase